MKRRDPDADDVLEAIFQDRADEQLDRALAAADKTTRHYPPDKGDTDRWELPRSSGAGQVPS